MGKGDCPFKGAYWISSNCEFFSFASYKVIAHPTIATAIVVALTRS